jgi:hypothetical protein
MRLRGVTKTWVGIFGALCLSAPISAATPDEVNAFESTRKNVDNVLEVLSQNRIQEGYDELQKLRDSDSLNSTKSKSPFEDLRKVEAEFRAIIISKGVAEKLVMLGLITPEILNSVVVFPANASSAIVGKNTAEWKAIAKQIASEIAVAIKNNDAKAKFMGYLKYQYFFDAYNKAIVTDQNDDFENIVNLTLAVSFIADVVILFSYTSDNINPGWVRGPLQLLIAPSVAGSLLWYFIWRPYSLPPKLFWQTLTKAGIAPPKDLEKNLHGAWFKSVLTESLDPQLFWRYGLSQKPVADMQTTMKGDYPCNVNLAALGVKGP